MNGAKASPRRSLPWWLSVLLAALLYALFSYYLPTLQPDHPSLSQFCQAGPMLAPLLAIPLLLLAAKQLYDIPSRPTPDKPVEPSDQPKQ